MSGLSPRSWRRSTARCCRSCTRSSTGSATSTSAAIPIVADVLNLSRAEVHGVVSFYHDFRRAPAGRHVLKVCRAEACQSMGCERWSTGWRQRFGIAIGGTTPDGCVTLETVYCLGNCALSPAVMLDGELHGRLDDIRCGDLLRQLGTSRQAGR